MTSGNRPFNPFWILLTVSATLFCITALAWIAAGFGQQASPLNQFLNARGGTVIGIEAVVTIVLAFLALIVDSRQSRTAAPEQKAEGDVAEGTERR